MTAYSNYINNRRTTMTCTTCNDDGVYRDARYRLWACDDCAPAGNKHWRGGITTKEANASIFDEETKDRGYDFSRVLTMRNVISKIGTFSANAIDQVPPYASAGVLAMTRYAVKQRRKAVA
ncbi:hypothetical protein J0X19_11885 [Hymenobacter sp. BT186]|uniref:Uncharacterized protein n=1 Tax=Hymenobacter telluris TaxID=2816474 RepID=A0A939JD86_9BACT|nr:hypothetical protein [Hymenobacter telluris]MBO0358648.1 hypothetical protein [Hymenobacter telluris]MBW3374674.1 hypothetical protein [Hymenobacter norwichensis]